ncbi:MAG: BMP family ABC transporter substrate-binding protein [Lachnospiraceae bacterium]|nr:BMP family ABC transporter substrate-binding protein [Lachnospiraceae bacterium]
MKGIKKILALVFVAVFAVGMLAACGGGNGGDAAPAGSGGAAAPAGDFKAGLICLHDENSTYDLNFINAFKEACEDMGLVEGESYFIKTNKGENEEAYQAACELVDQGCNVIFADSFGHEDYILQAAMENPDVQFCHATGTKAHTELVENYHNAFASIYEGRYLAGVAAGMKLNEMIESGKITADQAVMGYVGAYPYAEVKSGYTSFYLGAKSVCPTVTMQVTFTNSWYDETLEKTGAQTLIDKGCVLISQHADSMGAPTACEAAGVPNVSYNGSTVQACPNTFIVSSRIDWAPYFKYAMQSTLDGTKIDYDWVGTIDTGSVVLTEVNEAAAAPGTVDAIEAAKADLVAGNIHVFDTANFTVGGQALTSYQADVDDMGDFQPETEVIENGIFMESYYRSAPYFDIDIDGITILGDVQ